MSTEIVSVSCNHCGAALDVGDGARFVTCRYCQSRLEVKRTRSAVYTEVLSRIDRRTERMADDLAEIRRQTALEALDREWALRRDTLMVRNRDGSLSEPSPVLAVLSAAVIVGFGVVWLSAAAGMRAPSFFPVVGVVVLAIAVLNAGRSVMKASAYKREREAYDARRARLLRELDRAARGAREDGGRGGDYEGTTCNS